MFDAWIHSFVLLVYAQFDAHSGARNEVMYSAFCRSQICIQQLGFAGNSNYFLSLPCKRIIYNNHLQ